MNLRDYQKSAIDFLIQRDRAFIHAPAGSGKTVIGAHAVARSNARNAIWLCNTREQKQQAIDAIQQTEGGDTEVYVACVQESICTTAADLVVFDEAHHVPAKTWFDSINPKARLWGLSATPWSKDKDRDKVTADTFKEFFTIEREQLIDDGHLVPGEVRMIDWGVEGELDPVIEAMARPEIERRLRRWPWLPKQETESRVLYQVTRQALEDSIERLAAVHAAIPREGQTLILVGSIDYGKAIAGTAPDCNFVSSKTKNRKKLIEDFKAQRFQVLIATSLADEGLDCPCASTLILAAGGRAAGKLEQRAGRVLRPFPGKEKGLIIDFWDKPARLGLAQAHARLRTWRKLGYA